MAFPSDPHEAPAVRNTELADDLSRFQPPFSDVIDNIESIEVVQGNLTHSPADDRFGGEDVWVRCRIPLAKSVAKVKSLVRKGGFRFRFGDTIELPAMLPSRHSEHRRGGPRFSRAQPFD